MKIQIASEEGTMAMVVREPGSLDVISIRDPDDESFEKFKGLCRDVLTLRFHDMMEPTVDRKVTCPKEKHLLEAIDWCEGRDSVLIHCKAGVSRSSALATCIRCANGMTPREAFSKLNPLLHFPNPMIIDLGSGILGLDLRSERLRFEDQVSKVFNPDSDTL